MIADILEVIDAICKERNFRFQEIEEIKQKKRQERGGFNQRIILEIADSNE